MAHFAKIENGIVTEVLVVTNDDCKNLEFPESEAVGQAYLKSLGFDGEWLQTSYNSNFRKNYAGKGYTYDKANDMFIPPKPYESWILDAERGLWKAPVAAPSEKYFYIWDEDNRQWIADPALVPPDYEVE